MADLDDTIAAVAAESNFSGLIAVDRPGEPPFRRAVGLADRRWRVALHPAMRLAIASGTKGFTALAVMSLVETGELTLTTRARTLLGDDLPLIDDGVTVEHLLSHRSGIGDYLDEEQMADIGDHVLQVPVHHLVNADDYLAVLDGHPQVDPPGARFTYNNAGFVVLALLAERAARTPHAQLIDERVCRPAGLTATSFLRSDSLPADVAVGYLASDGLRTNILHLPLIGCGDGGLFTTLDDISRLWAAVFAGAIVSPATVASMTTATNIADTPHASYGLGFWLDHPRPTVSLEGYDAGVSFRSLHDPTTSATLTVAANWSDGAWPMLRALQPLLGFR